MDGLRSYGLSHLYLDEDTCHFSYVAAGLLIRALGAKLKVLYYNSNSKLKDFFINVLFKSNLFESFDVDFYESLDELNLSQLENYDLIIFDNFSLEVMDEVEILKLLKSRGINCEIVFVFSLRNDYEKVMHSFDLVSEFKCILNKSCTNKLSRMLNITGNGKGKSTYSFGHIIRSLIDKKSVGLVYFDKGGDFYSERFFFDVLSKFTKDNSGKIGKFDFYVSGMQRFDGKNFRFENKPEDLIEAKKGLDFAKKLILEKEVVILEELNTAISLKLLKFEEICEILNLAKCELLITGRYSPKDITSMSIKIVEVVEVKHYSKSSHMVRKGIDF